jgi:hypothetical protein
MMPTELKKALEAGDVEAAIGMFGDDVVLRVAVHDDPFRGRELAAGILRLVIGGEILQEIEVVESIGEPGEACVLRFTSRVTGYDRSAEGVLIVRGGGSGPIEDLTVFLRPLAALQALSDEVGRRLGALSEASRDG